MKLENRIAIVTGGSRGIGRAIADRFAEEGATVFVLDAEDPVDSPITERQQWVLGDVSAAADWEALVDRITADHGRVDILANNAGIPDYFTLDQLPLDVWERVIAVNQTGTMLGMRAVLPAMLSRETGSIVNISSIWGTVGAPGFAAYHASKGAVRTMTKNAAITYANRGIRVNSIHPGIVDTPVIAAQDAEANAYVVGQTPLGRMGRPEEIAAGALFLASDESSFVTGIELVIDGGYLAR